jgi:CBS domain-containing protein
MKAGTKRAKVAGAGASRRAKPRAAGRKPKRREFLPLHVGEVMTENPVCAETGSSLRDVARLLDEYEVSGLPVVDDQQRLVGVVSRTDLLHRLLEGPQGARRDEDWLDLLTADGRSSVEVDVARLGTVDDVMSVDPIQAKPEERLATVARRMAEERVHRLVVIDAEQHPVGIVTTLDLLRVYPA